MMNDRFSEREPERERGYPLVLYNYHSNVLLICYSISELSNYNSLAAVDLVAVCEILMMMVVSMVAKRRCYIDRILSSLFR